MLLVCRRDNSATAQPRAGVRVNPIESAAEVSIGARFRYTGVVARDMAQYSTDQHGADHVSYYGTPGPDVLLSHLPTHGQARSLTLVRSEGDTHGGEILTMASHRAPPTARCFSTTLTTAAIHLTLAAE